MKNKIDYTLYVVTDSELMSAETVEESVLLAVKGGATLVQLREKEKNSLKFYDTAKAVKNITDCFNIPLIINDRVDIALSVDAAGVHVGQSDLPAAVVRSIMGEDKIVGVSAANLEEAMKAKDDGADYIGVGAMFTTSTKTDARAVDMETLKEIKSTVQIPVVAIGGINEDTVLKLKGTGIDGIAVVSAILSKSDIIKAAEDMKDLFLETMKDHIEQ